MPYEDNEIFSYLDNQEVPPVLMEVLEQSQYCQLYNGRVVCEVRDYRCHSVLAGYDKHLLLLKPTTETLLATVNEMAHQSKCTHDEKLLLEANLLLATQPPLCLETTTDVLWVTNRLHYNQRKFHTPSVRRYLRKRCHASRALMQLVADEDVPERLSVNEFLTGGRQHGRNFANSWKRPKLSMDTSQLNFDALSVEVSRLAAPLPTNREDLLSPHLHTTHSPPSQPTKTSGDSIADTLLSPSGQSDSPPQRPATVQLSQPIIPQQPPPPYTPHTIPPPPHTVPPPPHTVPPSPHTVPPPPHTPHTIPPLPLHTVPPPPHIPPHIPHTVPSLPPPTITLPPAHTIPLPPPQVPYRPVPRAPAYNARPTIPVLQGPKTLAVRQQALAPPKLKPLTQQLEAVSTAKRLSLPKAQTTTLTPPKLSPAPKLRSPLHKPQSCTKTTLNISPPQMTTTIAGMPKLHPMVSESLVQHKPLFVSKSFANPTMPQLHRMPTPVNGAPSLTQLSMPSLRSGAFMPPKPPPMSHNAPLTVFPPSSYSTPLSVFPPPQTSYGAPLSVFPPPPTTYGAPLSVFPPPPTTYGAPLFPTSSQQSDTRMPASLSSLGGGGKGRPRKKQSRSGKLISGTKVVKRKKK
ncbi:proline-rich protein 36-like isoform X2 [Halichondria panicea]